MKVHVGNTSASEPLCLSDRSIDGVDDGEESHPERHELRGKGHRGQLLIARAEGGVFRVGERRAARRANSSHPRKSGNFSLPCARNGGAGTRYQ